MKRCSKRQLSVCRWALRELLVYSGILAAVGWVLPSSALAQASHAPWIWAREHQSGSVPRGECHFRKEFRVNNPQRAVLRIQADDYYDVYVNGKLVKSGSQSDRPDQIDISSHIKRGSNLVAVRVANRSGNTAGLSAQIMIQERGGQWVSHATGPSWKYNLHPLPFWTSPLYNDSAWKSPQTIVPAGSPGVAESDVLASAPRQPTPADLPWMQGNVAPTPAEASPRKVAAQPAVATKQEPRNSAPTRKSDPSGRFTIPDEFEVTQILDADKAGSLLAMTFNEFGQIVASREGGGLILVYDKDRDGVYETVRTYCDKVKNCQGVLCLNGEVYVTADGPDGAALYRLADADEDGVLENVSPIVKFRGEIGEHGPHGVVLGPDGMLYVIVGNHTSPVTEYDADSPHRHYYEGDLVGPRYEDPGGHANGVKAPGGVVLRTDISGKRVSLVAGGFRNAYDLTFNREGELFVHDSDMESDMGTTWYRPTQLYHVTSAAEFGWRSGWAKWPEYYIDRLPAIADTGRGSPTGAVTYNHHMFPARYHNALFLGDWSEGRIIAVMLTPNGASYTAKTENFLEGRPLNVTDLEVGPDGALYFCTGGRGTEGGLYRVAWTGKVPANVQNIGKGIEAVIRQPQLQSAWSRQEIARKRRDLADQWDRLVKGVARSKSNPWQYRVRALDVMMLYGPRPDTAFLLTLANDPDAEVRAKTAELLGRQKDREARAALEEMLADENARVRRKAAESLTAQGYEVSFEKLEQMLASTDRFEAWAARRLLELSDPPSYRSAVLQTDNPRLFVQGATAMLVAHPSKDDAAKVIQRTLSLMEGYVSDPDFIDMLRVMQLALIRGEFSAADAPDVRQAIEREFPANHSHMNRELIRLLAYLDATSIAERYMAYLRSPKAEYVDKLHVAMYLRFLKTPLDETQRLQLLSFYEDAARREGGGSYTRYVQNIAVDYVRTFTPEEGLALLERGDEFPTSAIGALYNLPPELDDATRNLLIDLEERISNSEGEAYERLRLGLIAVFARSGDAESMAHLRSMWDRDPERRGVIAMGLAQQPGGANWEYLLRSLPVLEGDPARIVLAMLRTVPYGPSDPEHYRQAILCGLRLKENGGQEAVALLDYWTNASVSPSDVGWEESLAAWQKWFNESYPDHPPAELPTASAGSKHQLDDLLEYLASEDRPKASATRGAVVFEKAQCAKCHRFGGLGKGLGPDLTSVGRRFSRREILESILFPSHVISDQYITKSIVTTGGRTFTGIVGAGSDQSLTVLLEDGRTVEIAKDQVDEMVTVKKSIMPEGLLDEWEREDVADLMEFLTSPPSTTVATPPITTQTR